MKQPEALRLADALDSDLSAEWMQGITLKHISNELRRLHEVNAELIEALKAMVDDGWLLHGPEGMNAAQTKVYAALAKAQGENND